METEGNNKEHQQGRKNMISNNMGTEQAFLSRLSFPNMPDGCSKNYNTF